MQKILTVVGARPQFIKAAALTRALSSGRRTTHEVMVHTGQHFDPSMSAVFFDELEIPPPAYNLGIHGLSHGAMTARMLEELEAIMLRERPDLVVIYGDTNSTLAGALAAAKLHIPLAHVEAGLRSFNRRMPEEVNRIVADQLSTILFCPTLAAVENLRREGIMGTIHQVGDVMYDVALATLARSKRSSTILARLNLTPRRYALATIHRADNTEGPGRFHGILGWLSEAVGDLPVVFPAHPRARALCEGRHIPANIRIVDPVGYVDMTWLTHNAAIVLTDSGGLQKEAYFHRVPCVTLRSETEWVETIESGWNRLWTVAEYQPRREIDDYGDGRAAARVAALLEEMAAER